MTGETNKGKKRSSRSRRSRRRRGGRHYQRKAKSQPTSGGQVAKSEEMKDVFIYTYRVWKKVR